MLHIKVKKVLKEVAAWIWQITLKTWDNVTGKVDLTSCLRESQISITSDPGANSKHLNFATSISHAFIFKETNIGN